MDGGDEAVHELLGRHIRDGHRSGESISQLPRDRMHQMGLAEADGTVEEERIEPWAGRQFGHAAGARVGEFVWFSDNETFERKTWIKGRRQFRSGIDTIVG